MVNAAKIVAQIAVLGSQILVKAFAEAYKQAALNAAKQSTAGGRVAAGVAEATSGTGSHALTRKLNMTLDEAAKILNVEKESGMETIAKRYEALFQANDPSKGGSFYIRSKIYRAKERLEMELQQGSKQS